MTKIWNESGFVTGDPWIIETEDRKAGPDEKAILSLDAFLEDHPRLDLHLHLSDGRVDMVRDVFDLALRVGPLTGSSLIARRLTGGHRVVCLGDVRPERGAQLQPGRQQLGTVRREVHVPHVQRGQIAGTRAGLAGQVRGSQQRVALFEHPLVVGAHPGVPGLPGDQEMIEVVTALGRVAADQR